MTIANCHASITTAKEKHMDLTTFLIISGTFTIFGYIWGRSNFSKKDEIVRIVTTTMESLENQGYLKTKIINGEPHYIKWPSENDRDSNT